MKNKLTDFALLFLRVALGVGLVYHGYGKLEHGVSEFAASSVEPMGFPLPIVWAWAAVCSELFGGIFIVLGLWTRWAALLAAWTMSVAFFIRQELDPFPQKEKALAYLIVCVFFILAGPGIYAVHPSGKGGKGKAPAAKPSK